MCSERDSPLEPFVLLAPGQPELARLICGAHLGPPVLTRKQKRPRVNSLVCDRVAAFSVTGPPEVLSRMSRPVTQAAERERELARACSQRLKQAAPSLPGESVSRGFADRGALEGYPSHYTSLFALSRSRPNWILDPRMKSGSARISVSSGTENSVSSRGFKVASARPAHGCWVGNTLENFSVSDVQYF